MNDFLEISKKLFNGKKCNVDWKGICELYAEYMSELTDKFYRLTQEQLRLNKNDEKDE